MKKILSIILTIALLMTTLTISFAGANAEEQKINRLLAFGDSVVYGDSAVIGNPMNGQKCGDQQFANLIAQEYGLNYISSSTNTTTDGRWYRKYAKNGAIMKNEDYLNANNGSILNQVTNCPDAVVAAADTIIMDGGINDVSKAVGIQIANTVKATGFSKLMQSYTYDEIVELIDSLKSMTDSELETFITENGVTSTLYTWQKIKSNIVDGYAAVVDTLVAKGFTGTIYMQNNLNPYAGSADEKMIYYWDSMINYFVTDSINTTIANYPDLDIKFVDLCSNVKNGSKYTGHSWSYGDNLHLTFAGNQAVYKYYSTFIDPDANTLDVGEDTLPSGISWKTLTTFDNGDLSRVTIGELVSLDDLNGVIDLTSPTSTTYMMKASEKAEINLSGIDFSNVYGIRVKFTNDKAGEFFTVSFGSDGDKQLYYLARNSKSNGLPALSTSGITSNAVIGDKSSQYTTTMARYSDIQNINSVSLTCGKTGDVVYVDAIQVYTALSQEEVDALMGESDTPIVTTSSTSASNSTSSTATTKTTTTTSTTKVTTTTTTTKADESENNIWFYIGNNGNASKTYTKSDYPDASDALQAAFDDVANGNVTLSSTSFICVNQNITLTKQIRYTSNKTIRLKNEYTMTYSPVDTENATTAIYGNGAIFFVYGPASAYTAGKQYVPYGDNAFFENLYFQGGGYFNGDLSIKNCLQIQKLGNFSNWNISGNLVLSGTSYKNANYYKASSVTIEGNFDYSGVEETYKTYVATIATTATINGKVISEPVDPLEVTSTMLDGAAIRLSEQKGIRFVTKLDAEKIAELRASGATVEYGTLIAPKDLLDGSELTFNLDSTKYVDVPYKANQWHMGVEGQIAGSLVTIKDENIARDFVGRAYVKVTKDGNTTTTYADYSNSDVANNTRSLAYVANALKGDTEKYGQLTETVKELVDKWAEKLLTA